MSCCLAFRTKYIGTGYYWTAVVLLAFYWLLVFPIFHSIDSKFQPDGTCSPVPVWNLYITSVIRSAGRRAPDSMPVPEPLAERRR